LCSITKWAHEIEVGPFEIDASPVTCAAFAAFIADRGYARAEFWSIDGSKWRAVAEASHPLYWRRAGSSWQVRRFDRWIELQPDEPVIHVNRFEAEAYCAWGGRHLPSAAQWLRGSEHPGFKLGRCWEWTSDMFRP
jgi:formylglycine-generating enzyme required for sulfatase activity